jgi:hypothetical protein
MLSAGNEWSKETLPVEYVSPSSAWLSSILSPAEASVFEHLYNWFDGKKKTKLYLSALFSWGERKGREAVIEKVNRLRREAVLPQGFKLLFLHPLSPHQGSGSCDC